jgi:hypothetical protein
MFQYYDKTSNCIRQVIIHSCYSTTFCTEAKQLYIMPIEMSSVYKKVFSCIISIDHMKLIYNTYKPSKQHLLNITNGCLFRFVNI